MAKKYFGLTQGWVQLKVMNIKSGERFLRDAGETVRWSAAKRWHRLFIGVGRPRHAMEYTLVSRHQSY